MSKTVDKKLPMTEEMCECGHSRSDHTRGRGVCFECYEKSDHGMHKYCSRWKRVVKVTVAVDK